MPAASTPKLSVQVLDFEDIRLLIQLARLICDFCSSGQRFACGFLQIPSRSGHPCRPAIDSPCRLVGDFHSLVTAPCRAHKETAAPVGAAVVKVASVSAQLCALLTDTIAVKDSEWGRQGDPHYPCSNLPGELPPLCSR